MGTRKFKRNKYCIRIVILLLLTVIPLYGLFSFVEQSKYDKPPVITVRRGKVPKKVHFSVDDATSIFQNIWWENYDSIFENEILGTLQKLHVKYDIKVTLYLFGELETFAIWDFPLKYQEELAENADWLHIGFHSGEDCNSEEDYADIREFQQDYERAQSTFQQLIGEKGVTTVLRLHNWYATEEMTAYLQEEGVTALLCRDSEDSCYDLTEEQTRALYGSRDGVLEKDGLLYYATDIRLEKTENIFEVLEKSRYDRVLVIFTHAWCFQENSDKLTEAVQWLWQKGYEFTDLEPAEK